MAFKWELRSRCAVRVKTHTTHFGQSEYADDVAITDMILRFVICREIAVRAMKALLTCSALLASAAAMAAGYSTAAVPTRIDVVRNEGFMIYGEFGNPGGCTFGNQLFVRSDHPQYKQLYALALTAHASKQKISAYVHGCENVLWYSAAPNTFGVVYSYGSLAIAD